MKYKIVMLGSVASGKTTLAKKVKNMLDVRGIPAKYVDININHGPSYLITRLLVKALRLTYKSNFYLTIRFNNTSLFCRLLSLMILLDIIYAPIKIIYSIFIPSINNKILIIDEYYINGLIDYLYYSSKLCRISSFLSKLMLKLFNKVVIRLSIHSLRKSRCVVASLVMDPAKSVRGWLKREKISDVDVNHILFRTAASKVMSKAVSSSAGCVTLESDINNVKQDIPRTIKRIMTVIGLD